ncbi:unnamed protein product [Durusdinium trenchii]|uniref:Uncharacterized protein n=1 Tax=Durusdinium trenchii TaxID=1381693 RepID=A0ABP0SPF8_9DINO
MLFEAMEDTDPVVFPSTNKTSRECLRIKGPGAMTHSYAHLTQCPTIRERKLLALLGHPRAADRCMYAPRSRQTGHFLDFNLRLQTTYIKSSLGCEGLSQMEMMKGCWRVI